MKAIKARRTQRTLSQRELARRAGISYKTLQLLEAGRHDPRLSTLTKVAEGLGLPPKGLEEALEDYLRPAGDSVEAVSRRMAAEGEPSWTLWLFDFVDAFRRTGDPALAARPPGPEAGPRALALLASTVEFLCSERGIAPPWWCAGAPALPEPWFLSGVENLKASALVESPAQFRKRNLFVLGNFLERA